MTGVLGRLTGVLGGLTRGLGGLTQTFLVLPDFLEFLPKAVANLSSFLRQVL